MNRSSTFSLIEARGVALSAQGFGAKAGMSKMIDRLGVLQIDSVNVLVRAHYLPLFSRLGRYDMRKLDQLAYEKRGLFEYWGHQASLLPIQTFSLMRWRMDEVPSHPRVIDWIKRNKGLLAEVEQQVRERGPIAASDLEAGGKRSGQWWGWSDGKFALEHLFTRGVLTTHHRRNFERVYDLTERVIPPAVLKAPVPQPEEAVRALIMTAARAMGVATTADLANYFQMTQTVAGRAVRDLVAEGDLEQVKVEGWAQPAFVPRGLGVKTDPPSVSALLSPFDPLVWFRDRTLRLFGMHYRIEIYVPEPKRIYGYYVLPYLLDGALVGRVDLKADRKASALLVKGAYLEDGVAARSVAPSLQDDLEKMARWLGLSRVDVKGCKGDAGKVLRSSPVIT